MGDRLVAGGFAAIMLVWLWEAFRLPYVVNGQPGPGFFPVWLSAAGLTFSLIALARGLRRRESAATAQGSPGPDGENTGARQAGRLIAALIGLIAFFLLVPVLGFVAGLTLYLIYLTLAVLRMAPWRSLKVTIGTVASIFLVFGVLLDIPFPTGMIGI